MQYTKLLNLAEWCEKEEFWRNLYENLVELHPTEIWWDGNGDLGTHVFQFARQCAVEKFYDFIELGFVALIQGPVRRSGFLESWKGSLTDLVECVNLVFETYSGPCQLTPFQFEPMSNAFYFKIVQWPQIYMVSDEVTHQEAVEPALRILNNPRYRSADEEVRKAMKAYRQGRYDNCMIHSNNALESVMKIVCKKNGWPYQEKDTARTLVDTVVCKSTLDKSFKSWLQATSSIRNNYGGHGSSTPIKVERHIAQYVLTNAASSIVLIVNEADP